MAELVNQRRSYFKFTTPLDERLRIYNEFAQKKTGLVKEAEKLVQQMREEIEKDEDGRDSRTTTGFATFESNHSKNEVYISLYENWMQKLCNLLTFGFYQPDTLTVVHREETYHLKVSLAAEPEDVVWTNIGYTRCDLVGRKALTFLVTFFILAFSFAVQYFLLNYQKTSQLSAIQYAISIVVSVLNFVLSGRKHLMQL